MCAVHLSSVNPQFQSCSGSHLVTDLDSGVNYIFSAIATDGVGNTGEAITYLWKIGNSYIYTYGYHTPSDNIYSNGPYSQLF